MTDQTPSTQAVDTKVDAVPETTPAQTPETTPTMTLEQALSELAAARKEAAKYRTEKREAVKGATEKLTEVEQLNKRLSEMEAELKQAKRSDIARKYNLPDELAKRLRGETLEEIEADAVVLAATIKPTSTTPPQTINPTAPAGAVKLTREAIAKMSTSEVNKLWAEGTIQKVLESR